MTDADGEPVTVPPTSSGIEEPVAEPVEAFPPTLREVMLRPRWLALLALSLAVAGVFAWLGQWQLGQAVQAAPVAPGATEQVRPIDEVVQPGEYLPGPLVGQRIEVSGTWVPGDFIVVAPRVNDGVEGYWVTGQLRVADSAEPASLAVAVGWAADAAAADAAASALSREAETDAGSVVLTGRLIPDEGAVPPPRDGDAQAQVRMSPVALLARWHDTEGLAVYRPYLTSAEPLGGLDAISSPPPDDVDVDWLNLFYAAEWAVFAGFAFYLWYRLARDAWEREVEDLAEESDRIG